MPYEAEDPVFVGPYRILHRLGEGGMGVVYLALDQAGRAVALKLLGPAAGADPQARRRLAREVETLLLVRHPNVAAVLDAELGGDRPYIVTAFVPGQTLEQHVEAQGALPAEQVARLGRTLADALRAIHAVGVIHRDLKPANVMLLDGEPVIIDFGIARLADDTRLTVTGLVMGTPGYLSPEVVDGHPVTPATDWWGWGVLLAYAATGRPPFGAGSTAAVLDRVRRGACDLAGVDARLASVLGAALVVDPGRRPAVEVLLSGLSSLSRPAATLEQAAAQERPRPRDAAGFGRPLFGTAGQPPAAAVPAAPVPVPPPAAEPKALSPNGFDRPPVADPAARTVANPPARTVPYTLVDAAGTHARPPSGHAPPNGQNPYSQNPYSQNPHSQNPNGHNPVPLDPVPPNPVAPDPDHALPSEPGLVGGTLLLGLATLAAMAAVTPGLAIVLSLLWLVAARVTDATVTGLLRRRYQRGNRPGDVATTVAALPWRVVVATGITLLALLIPLLLAGSTAFLIAAASNPGAPKPNAAGPLAVGMVAGWVAAWWGPGGSAVRRGSRIAVRGLLPRRPLHIAVGVALGFVLVASLLVANSGAAPDWGPVRGGPNTAPLSRLTRS